MWAESYLPVILTTWQTWLVIGVGAVTSTLTLLASCWLLFRRNRSTRKGLTEEKGDFDPFVNGSLTEKRKSGRREGNPVEVFITDNEEENESIRGWIVDRSMGGVRLLVYEPIDLGKALIIRPRQAPPGVPWTQIVVKSCERTKSGYQ